MEVIVMIIMILEMYVFIGLIFALGYMIDVGRRISKKYGCGLMEGIYRFEKAGDTMSNIGAVLWCIVLWPAMYVALKRGSWDEALKEMVEENDYSGEAR
jgi:hypothetical protein